MKPFGSRIMSRRNYIMKLLFLGALTFFLCNIYFFSNISEIFQRFRGENLATQKFQEKMARYMQRGIPQTSLLAVDDNLTEIEKAQLLGLDDGITTETRRLMNELNIINAGENGVPVVIPENVSDEVKKLNQTMWETYGYNALASSMISLNRALPDNRSSYCKNKKYPKYLPKASIIIQFHDDDWMLLMRNIHSILLRTPDHLVEEILLVYDPSNREYYEEKLDEYIKKIPKVRLIRSANRQGVISMRILGYRNAIGPVLVYLDSHVEVTPGWIEPILARIKHQPNAIMWPKTSSISSSTMQVWLDDFPGALGSFTWNLGFEWINPSVHQGDEPRHLYEPKPSVTFIGAAFAIRKDFFKRIGLLDMDFDIWGGEDVELAFRAWMCGGRVEQVPCSVVAHMYKTHTYKMQTEKGGPIYNSDRIAEIWLDEYKRYYYRTNGDTKNRNYGNITDRVHLRKTLNCKSFRWFIENIHPNIDIPDNIKDLGTDYIYKTH